MQPDFGESVVRIRKNEIFPSEMTGKEKQTRVKINPTQIQFEEQTQPKPDVMLVRDQNEISQESEPQNAESVSEVNTESHALKLDISGPIKLTSQVHGLSITFPSFNLMVQDLSKINTQELFKELIQWIKTLKNV